MACDLHVFFNKMERINYFKQLKDSEILNLENICDKWSSLCLENKIPEEEIGSVLSNIGQSKLLISGKFHQFSGLLEVAQNANIEEFKVSEDELQGFWDLVMIQIEDINNKFNSLEKLKENNWVRPVVIRQETEIKKKIRKKNTNGAYTQAARRRLSAIKSQMKAQMSISDSI